MITTATIPSNAELQPIDISATIHFNIIVQRPENLKDFADSIIAGENTHISREEFHRRFSATDDSIIQIINWATDNDLTVTETHAPSATVKMLGSVDTVNKLFNIELQHVTIPDYAGVSWVGDIVVPKEIVDVVDYILGLNSPMMSTKTVEDYPVDAATSAGLQSLTPEQVANAYNFPVADGTGQCVGIIEYGGGWTNSNLFKSFALLGITAPTVIDVPVRMPDGTIATNAYAIGGSGAGGSSDVEVMLDIYCVGGVVPKATIAMYWGDLSLTRYYANGNPFTINQTVWSDPVNAAIHDSVNNPSVLSISWGTTNYGDGSTLWLPGVQDNLDTAFHAAIALGITVCVASGDAGSTWYTTGVEGTLYPGSSPYVLCVGGTTLTLDTDKNIFNEKPWSYYNPQFNLTTIEYKDGRGTGGGVSQWTPPAGEPAVPTWQAGLNYTAFAYGPGLEYNQPYIISSLGTYDGVNNFPTDFVSLGASSNAVGTLFIADNQTPRAVSSMILHAQYQIDTVGTTDWGSLGFTASSLIQYQRYTIASVGTTDFVSIGASANTVGIEFTANQQLIMPASSMIAGCYYYVYDIGSNVNWTSIGGSAPIVGGTGAIGYGFVAGTKILYNGTPVTGTNGTVTGAFAGTGTMVGVSGGVFYYNGTPVTGNGTVLGIFWGSGSAVKPLATLPARGVPDVSANADPLSGYTFYYGMSDTYSGPIGGTSAATPVWAALIARINQLTGQNTGFINTTLYKNYTPTPTAITTYSDVSYGTDGLQKVDIIVPNTFDFNASTNAKPIKGVVVYTHGGGWAEGDKTTSQVITTNVALANYIVVSVNYRLTTSTAPLYETPTGFFPNNLNDVKTVFKNMLVDGAWANMPSGSQSQWSKLRNFVKTYGVGFMGDSAGGHLSILAAFENALDNGGVLPETVINFVGPMNLVYDATTNPFGTEAATYLSQFDNGDPSVLTTASPYYRLPTWKTSIPNLQSTTCKFTFWYSDNDTLVPPTSITPFVNDLTSYLPNNVNKYEVAVGNRAAGTDGYPSVYQADHWIPNYQTTIAGVAIQALDAVFGVPTALFNDITTGNNATNLSIGYAATTGWDAVTGLGTPNGTAIYNLLKTQAVATLSNLTITKIGINESPAAFAQSFSSSVTAYTISVTNDINAVRITPTVTNSLATITINGQSATSGASSGTLYVNVGANTITIVVTAPDGVTTKTYVITVTRAAGVTVALNVPYGSDALQFVNVYQPVGTPIAAIVRIHGGSWTSGNGPIGTFPSSTAQDPMMFAMATAGYAVLDVNYRSALNNGSGQFSGANTGSINDIVTVLQNLLTGTGNSYATFWPLAYNAISSGLKLLVTGISAGGHLALSAVCTYGTASGKWPYAVQSIEGPMNISNVGLGGFGEFIDTYVMNAIVNPYINTTYHNTNANALELASPFYQYGTTVPNGPGPGPWFNAVNASPCSFYFVLNNNDTLVTRFMSEPTITSFAANNPNAWVETLNEGPPLGLWDGTQNVNFKNTSGSPLSSPSALPSSGQTVGDGYWVTTLLPNQTSSTTVPWVYNGGTYTGSSMCPASVNGFTLWFEHNLDYPENSYILRFANYTTNELTISVVGNSASQNSERDLPLTAGTTGTAFSNSFVVSGGTAPYTYSVIKGVLPAGISLSNSGTLSGTPTQPGYFRFSVQAQDSVGLLIMGNYQLTITAATPPIYTKHTLPSGDQTLIGPMKYTPRSSYDWYVTRTPGIGTSTNFILGAGSESVFVNTAKTHVYVVDEICWNITTHAGVIKPTGTDLQALLDYWRSQGMSPGVSITHAAEAGYSGITPVSTATVLADAIRADWVALDPYLYYSSILYFNGGSTTINNTTVANAITGLIAWTTGWINRLAAYNIPVVLIPQGIVETIVPTSYANQYLLQQYHTFQSNVALRVPFTRDYLYGTLEYYVFNTADYSTALSTYPYVSITPGVGASYLITVSPTGTITTAGTQITWTVIYSNETPGATINYTVLSSPSSTGLFVEGYTGSVTSSSISNSGSFTVTKTVNTLVADNNSYSITLQVTDGVNTGTSATAITIQDPAPAVTATITTGGVTALTGGQSVTYSVTVNNLSAGSTTVTWNFNDTGYFTDSSGGSNSPVSVTVTPGSNTFTVTKQVKAVGLLTADGLTHPLTFTVSRNGSSIGSNSSVGVNDPGIPPTYTITSTTSGNNKSLSAGDTVTYTITYSNVPIGTTVYWTLSDAAVFTDTSTSGTVTTSNTATSGTVTVVKTVVKPFPTLLYDGQSHSPVFKVYSNQSYQTQLGNTDSTITIQDPTLSYTTSLTTPTSIIEGGTISITVTTNGVADGTTLYYINNGTADGSVFANGNNYGSFTISAPGYPTGTGTITRTVVSTLPAGGATQTFTPQIHFTSSSGPTFSGPAISTVTITNPTYAVSHTPSTVIAGGLITWTADLTNVAIGTTLYFTTDSSFPFDYSSSSYSQTANVSFATVSGVNSYSAVWKVSSSLPFDNVVHSVYGRLYTGNYPVSGGTLVATDLTAASVQDPPPQPGYSIAASGTPAAGQTITYTITASNVSDGTVVYWTVDDNSVFSGSASGQVTINSGSATVTKSIITPLPIDGVTHYITFKLYSDSQHQTQIGISNTQVSIQDPAPPTTYSVAASTSGSLSAVGANQTITYTITYANIPANTTLYWTLSDSSVVTTDHDSVVLSGTSGTATVTVTTNATLSYDSVAHPETFKLYTESSHVNQVGTSNTQVIIQDPGPTYVPTLTTSSSIIEGDTLSISVATVGVANGTILYFTNAGTAAGSIFTDGNNYGSFTISAPGYPTGTGTITRTVVSTLPAGGATQTFTAQIRTGSIGGTAVGSPATPVTISNPTYSVSHVPPVIKAGDAVVWTGSLTNVAVGTTLYVTYGDVAPFVEQLSQGSFVTVAGQNSYEAVFHVNNPLPTDGVTHSTQVKLYTGNYPTNGGVLVATDPTLAVIQDPSPVPGYLVTADHSTLTAGQTVHFTITTTNVTIGSSLYWSIGDNSYFSDSAGSSGTVQVTGNPIVITKLVTSSLPGDSINHSVTFFLYTGGQAANGGTQQATTTVSIQDPTSTYSIAATGTPTAGQTITYTITTTNILSGTPLYWTIDNSNLFTDGLGASGTFTVTTGTNTVQKQITSSLPIDSILHTIAFSVYTDAAHQVQVGTTNRQIQIQDPSPSPTYVISHTITPNTSTITTSGVTVIWTATVQNVANGTVLYAVISDTSVFDPALSYPAQLPFTVVDGITAYTGTYVTKTLPYDGVTHSIGANVYANNYPPIGTLLASDPTSVVVQDPGPTYSMSLTSASSIIEGGQITITVTTTGVADGTVLRYTNSGTAGNSVFNDGSNSGTFTVSAPNYPNGTGTITKTLVPALPASGSPTTFTAQIRDGSNNPLGTAATTVTINYPTYSISNGLSTAVVYDQQFSWTVTYTNVSIGSRLYWALSSGSYFTDQTISNSVSISTSNGSFTVPKTVLPASSLAYDSATHSVTFTLLTGASTVAAGGVSVGTNSVTVQDPGPSYSIDLEGTSQTQYQGGAIAMLILTTGLQPGGTLTYTNIGTAPGSLFVGGTTSGSMQIIGTYPNTFAGFYLKLLDTLPTNGGSYTFIAQISNSTNVIASSSATPITIYSPGYTVYADASTLTVNQTVDFYISYSSIPYSTTVYWSLSDTVPFTVTVPSQGYFVTSGTQTSGILGPVTRTVVSTLTADGTTHTPSFTAYTGSQGGTNVGSTTVTIQDPSPSTSYLITPSATSLSPNQTVVWTITYSNVPVNTILYWSVTDVSVFTSGTNSATGSFSTSGSLTSGTATVSKTVNSTLTADGTKHTAGFNLYSDSGRTVNVASTSAVTIQDPYGSLTRYIVSTLPAYPPSPASDSLILQLRLNSTSGPIVATAGQTVTISYPTYSVTTGGVTSVSAGGTVTYTINTANVPVGTTLYWSIADSATGSIFATDSFGTSGSFTTTGNTYTIGPKTVISSLLYDSIRHNITFTVFTGALSGGSSVQVAQNTSVYIQNPTPSYTASLSFSATQIENGSIGIVVQTVGVADGTTLYYTNSGTAAGSIFTDGYNYGSFNVVAGSYPNGSGGFIKLIKSTLPAGGATQTFIGQIRTGSTSGTVVATAATVTITNPSYSISVDKTAPTAGQTVTWTITYSNIPTSTTLYWQLSDASVFTDTSTTGSFSTSATLTGSTATVTKTVNNPLSYDNTLHSITFTLYTDNYPANGGTSVATNSLVSIQDPASSYSTSLTSGTSIIEGGSISITVTGVGIASGTTLYYTNNGTAGNSVFTSGSNSGSFQLSSGTFPNCTGTISLTIVNPLPAGGATQTFIGQVRTGSASGTVVATAATVTITNPNYTVAVNKTSPVAGDLLTYTPSYTNVAAGTTLYWGVNNTSLFSSATSGSFNTTTFPSSTNVYLTVASTLPYDGVLNNITFQLFTDSAHNNPVAFNTQVNIQDPSANCALTLNTGTSIIENGQVVITATILSSTLTSGSTLYYTNSGTAANSVFASGSNSGSFTITGTAPNFTGTISFFIANPLPAGGATQTFIAQVRTGSTSGPVFGSPATTVTITNPSYSITPSATYLTAGSQVTWTGTINNVAPSSTIYVYFNDLTLGSYFTDNNYQGSFAITAGVTQYTASRTVISSLPSDGATHTVNVQLLTGGYPGTGTQVASDSTVVIHDPSITYAVDGSSVFENYGSNFTVTTSGVANGTTLYWTINTSYTSDWTATSGSFTISSNSGTITIQAGLLTPNVNHAFTVQVLTGSTSGTVVATSPTRYAYGPADSISRNYLAINEGGSVTFTITPTNVGYGQGRYWTITGVTSSRVSAASGSYVSNGFASTDSVVISVNNNYTTDGSTIMYFNLYNDAAKSSLIASTYVGISDTSITPTASATDNYGRDLYTYGLNQGSYGVFKLDMSNSSTGVPSTVYWENTGTWDKLTTSSSGSLTSSSKINSGTATVSGGIATVELSALLFNATAAGTVIIKWYTSNGGTLLATQSTITVPWQYYSLSASSNPANNGSLVTFYFNSVMPWPSNVPYPTLNWQEFFSSTYASPNSGSFSTSQYSNGSYYVAHGTFSSTLSYTTSQLAFTVSQQTNTSGGILGYLSETVNPPPPTLGTVMTSINTTSQIRVYFTATNATNVSLYIYQSGGATYTINSSNFYGNANSGYWDFYGPFTYQQQFSGTVTVSNASGNGTVPVPWYDASYRYCTIVVDAGYYTYGWNGSAGIYTYP